MLSHVALIRTTFLIYLPITTLSLRRRLLILSLSTLIRPPALYQMASHSWVYNSEVPAEDVERYVPGGFHPVLLNDRLKHNRYHILHKLGFGSFGTVWLAKDYLNNRNVTLKILVADQSDEKSCRELQILEHLRLNTSTFQHPGRKHIASLIDFFYINGPNGRHLALVLEPIGPMTTLVKEYYNGERLPGKLAREVSRQLLLAVDYLHQSNVAHGDIHMGNILFRYPGLDTLSPEQITTRLGSPLTGRVTRRDGGPLPPNAPDYLVEPTSFSQPLPEFCAVELIDFGEAFFLHDPPKTLHTPPSLHPPEVVFQLPLSEAVDIWNLGCTTFELVMGSPLFWVLTTRSLPPMFEKVCGDMPAEWMPHAVARGIFAENEIDMSSAQNFVPLEEEVFTAYASMALDDATEENLGAGLLDALARSLRRMLVLKPEARATTRELLHQDWFRQTVPVICAEIGKEDE
ncbi:kinase-like domain-containing protein [Kalaharituber pfeilii]|nr:kinase-like domain-containing protein [Kalaharituber pfeilii]